MTNSDDPTTVAVLCVECQNGVLGPESVLPQLAADSAGLIANLHRLLDAARTFGARVVHATYEGALGGEPTGTARLWRALGPLTASWKPGDPETQVIPELLGSTDLVSPRHHGLFPTMDSELLPILKGLGVRTVVLAGVSLNLALPHHSGACHPGRVRPRRSPRRRWRDAERIRKSGAGQHYCCTWPNHHYRRSDRRVDGQTSFATSDRKLNL
jgi:hypothetical protein